MTTRLLKIIAPAVAALGVAAAMAPAAEARCYYDGYGHRVCHRPPPRVYVAPPPPVYYVPPPPRYYVPPPRAYYVPPPPRYYAPRPVVNFGLTF